MTNTKTVIMLNTSTIIASACCPSSLNWTSWSHTEDLRSTLGAITWVMSAEQPLTEQSVQMKIRRLVIYVCILTTGTAKALIVEWARVKQARLYEEQMVGLRIFENFTGPQRVDAEPHTALLPIIYSKILRNGEHITKVFW